MPKVEALAPGHPRHPPPLSDAVVNCNNILFLELKSKGYLSERGPLLILTNLAIYVCNLFDFKLFLMCYAYNSDFYVAEYMYHVLTGNNCKLPKEVKHYVLTKDSISFGFASLDFLIFALVHSHIISTSKP